VIDAVSGAIYVIGGYGGTGYYQDVWVSTDGGARPASVRRVVGGLLRGVLRVYSGVLMVLQKALKGELRGTQW
jgi:hypothetical protein